MKITKIVEKTKFINSSMKNAYIDFSKMTLILVAICSDVKKNGKQLIGYGFNSNGRYGQGNLMRERFIPRIMESNHNDLLNEKGNNFDPHKIWDVMMKMRSLVVMENVQLQLVQLIWLYGFSFQN